MTLFLYLLCFVASCFAFTTVLKIGNDGFSGKHVVLFVIGFCGSVINLIWMISIPVMTFNYLSADQKAKIINREFGTEYTAVEIFFASDVIDKIQHIKRHRIELNGNLNKKEGE